MSKSKVFKKLNLDRQKIDKWIRDYCGLKFKEFEYNGISHVNNNLYRSEFLGDGRIITIDFYFNQDGTTTINPAVGKHREISIDCAFYIREQAGDLADRKNFSYSIHRMKKEDVERLLEYLLENDRVKKTGFDEAPNYTLHRYESSFGDRITLKYFTNGTLQVQGKPLYLYQEVTCFLAEYYPFEQLIDAQAEYFHVSIKKEDIKHEINTFLRYSQSFLGDHLVNMISTSIIYKQIDIDLDDYTSFVFPVLRVLEGYIKKLFLSKNYTLPKRGFNDIFICPFGDKFELRESVKESIKCEATCNAIEKAYNYYNKNRHGLFHIENIPEASRFIQNKHEAIRIINEVLILIEETYRTLPIHQSSVL